MRSASASVLLLLVVACTHVQSSAYATNPTAAPTSDPVVVSATRDPSGGTELGIIEAHARLSAATLGQVLDEFKARVASLGGNYGRIDRYSTKYETITESYTYDCGTTTTSYQSQTVCQPGYKGAVTCNTQSIPVSHHTPMTCTGTRQVEVATLTFVGRGFRIPKGSP